MRTVVALYDRMDQARQAVKDLTDAGFTSEDLNLISQDASGEYSRYLNDGQTRTGDDVSEGAATGAGVGAVLGGLGGLLLGLGALAIPGIGPVIAAGPIAAALAGAGIGAVAGGLVGALADLGIPEEHAQYYAEGVRRGATLVTVRVHDERAEEARDILNRHQPIDLDKTVSNWRANNWSKFDESAQPYDASQREFNRSSASLPVSGGVMDDEYRDRDTYGSANAPVTGELMDDEYRDSDIHRGSTSAPMTGDVIEDDFRNRDMNRSAADRPLTGDTMDDDYRDRDMPITGSVTGGMVNDEYRDSETNRSLGSVPVTGDVDDEFRDHNVNREFDSTRSDMAPGFEAMDDEDTESDRPRNFDFVSDNIPVTGETPMGVRDRDMAGTGMDDPEWTKYDLTCRRDFMERFVTSGHDYAYYQPAYRFGYTLANDERYHEADWNVVEPEARREWERESGQTAWDDVKDAVRYAWRNVTGRH